MKTVKTRKKLKKFGPVAISNEIKKLSNLLTTLFKTFLSLPPQSYVFPTKAKFNRNKSNFQRILSHY